MARDEEFEQRVRRFLDGRGIRHETKRMMGGLCVMVDGKMFVGIRKDRLMARIGPDAYDEALKRKGCRPMDFTGRPLRGFVFVDREGFKSDADLAHWLDLALAYNPKAKKSESKKRKAQT